MRKKLEKWEIINRRELEQTIDEVYVWYADRACYVLNKYYNELGSDHVALIEKIFKEKADIKIPSFEERIDFNKQTAYFEYSPVYTAVGNLLKSCKHYKLN